MPANSTAHHSTWGAKIGPRIAKLVSDAIIYTHMKLVGTKHKLAMMVFNTISDEISDEVDITLGPLIARMHDAIDPSHPAYPAIHFLHTATGQLKAIAGTGAQISGLLGSVSAIMNNELAPVVYQFINANPHLVPSAGDVANMAAAGIIDDSLATSVIGSNGYDSGWAAAYLESDKSYPTYDVGLELLRRGQINGEDFNLLLQRSGIPEQYWGPIATMRNAPVSVADAALAVLRGDITATQGADIAAQNGFTLDSFNILIGNTGEPPGTEQLLEAYRRGFIDKATLEHGILQSRTRDEWIPTIEKLRYTPMSVADAVNAVVQNYMTQDQGAAIADQNGLQPGDFATLYETAGEPLSRTELEELYNRGLIDEDTVIQGLRESRLKNKYNQLGFDLHAKILPIFTLRDAMRYGGVPVDYAVQQVMENGYDKTAATIVVNSASNERLQTYKDKVVAAVMSMYEDNVISETEATSLTTGMGYTTEEASFILQSSEFHRQVKLINAAVNAVKSKYLGHHINSNTAIGLIDAIGIPSQQRDELIKVWEIEASAYTTMLTEAQIVKAVTDGLITAADGLARLEAKGYSAGDAALLLGGA